MTELPQRRDYSDVAVIIPALNEEASLPRVLRDLPPVAEVIVVDNGSGDATAEVARASGATVVDETERGYGAACLRGLAELERMISEDRLHPEIVVFIDADYSDYPEELGELVEPIRQRAADFVVGSRLKGNLQPGAMPFQSRFGNRLACFLIRLLFGVRYTDLGPFRAIRLQTLRSLQMTDRNFGWTVEMQIKAARLGVATAEVPVSYRQRVGVSKISGTISGSVRAGYKILYLIARFGLLPKRS